MPGEFHRSVEFPEAQRDEELQKAICQKIQEPAITMGMWGSKKSGILEDWWWENPHEDGESKPIDESMRIIMALDWPTKGRFVWGFYGELSAISWGSQVKNMVGYLVP